MTSPARESDHQHDQQQKADRQIPDVHVLPRRNEVAVIAALAPCTIAFLQVPLTPARAARLAAFTARTGVDAQQLVVDLIDDVIFAREVVLSGGLVPCTEHCEVESMRREKSSARSCMALHDCALPALDVLAEDCGPSKQPRSSPRASDAPYAPPPTSFPVSASHQRDQSPPSSSRSPSANREGCGND